MRPPEMKKEEKNYLFDIPDRGLTENYMTRYKRFNSAPP